MKIGFITTDTREYLKDYGIPSPSFGTAPTSLLEGFAFFPEVEIHVISCARQPMRPQERLAENIVFHSLHVPRVGWMRTAYQGCIRATRKKLQEVHPDIVHGQGTEQDCSLDAVLSGFPNVLTIHGNMRLIAKLEKARPFSFLWLAARLEALTIPRSDGVICITEYTRKAIKPLAQRCWLLPNAVERSFFDVQPQATASKPTRILCVGVISRRKNQIELIRALDSLESKHRIELVFLGIFSREEPYITEFKDLIATRPWCTYAGFADRARLRDYFRTASLVVLPSLEDNCPMVVLEAMAAGVPVVASGVGGVPDLVEDGNTGLLCDPHRPSTITQAVDALLGNPNLAESIARKAKARARARFHPKTIAERHLKIYQEVLAGR